MAKLWEAVETALEAGRVSIPPDLSPDELAGALPGILQEALDRMGRASLGFDHLERAVATAAEGVERSHPPVSGGNAAGVQSILADGIRRAKASAAALRGRVGDRRTRLQQWGIHRIERAAGMVEAKRRELQAAQDALIADARQVARECR